MKKKFTDYVYLSELDSVRTSRQEQEAAEKALFKAIVYEGKAVVLTYNQIIDSIAFLHCIKDEKAFKALLDFFKDGKLLVNQYKPNMNLSKYFQENIHKATSFHSTYFSFLVEYSDEIKKQIYHGMNQSIQYGDKLFLENSFIDEIKEIDRKALIDYVELILTINSYMNEYECYVVPKSKEELENHKMNDYLHKIIDYLNIHDPNRAGLLSRVLEIHLKDSHKDTRSMYKKIVEEIIPINEQQTLLKLIDLAYNSALEFSIPIINPIDHLQDDVKLILDKASVSCDINKEIAFVFYKWEDGYRVTSVTTFLYQKIKWIKWKFALMVCPFVEATKIGTSALIAFIVMCITEKFSFVQNLWETYSWALAITFLYNISLNWGQELLTKILPKWIYDTGIFQQIKYLCIDSHLVYIKRRNGE